MHISTKDNVLFLDQDKIIRVPLVLIIILIAINES